MIKELAELFIMAMNDWPTFNQSEIDDFLKELKMYFGTPLTIEKLTSKSSNFEVGHNAWKHEAGASIAEMISKSERFTKESDFDKIIHEILRYYKPK